MNNKILGSMPDAEYRALEGLAQSDLAMFKRSPKHYLKRAVLRKETAAMKFGTIFHTAILEPKRFKELYTIEPSKVVINGVSLDVNKRMKAHREYLEAWRMDNADRMILTEKEADSLTVMLTEVSADPLIVSFIEAGVPECVSTWEMRGRKCKGKADLYVKETKHGTVVVDFKKTQDASQNGFSRSILNYSYELQDAWYSEGFKADKFIIVAVEESTGATGIWDCSLFLERGQHLIEKYMDKLAECERTNTWHWYTNGIELIQPPTWMNSVTQDEEIAV